MYGVGFSLRPPKWLRNTDITLPGGGKIKVSDTGVTLPGGFSTSTGTNRSAQAPQAAGMGPIAGLPDWVVPVAIGAAALLFLPKLMKR